jgi:hypothetical protein
MLRPDNGRIVSVKRMLETVKLPPQLKVETALFKFLRAHHRPVQAMTLTTLWPMSLS